MSGLVEEEIVDPPVQPEENVFGSNSDVVQPWYPFFLYIYLFQENQYLMIFVISEYKVCVSSYI